jgi:hypothetical protein
MTRYLYNVGGHIEVYANSLQEATDKLNKLDCIVHNDPAKDIVLVISPIKGKAPFHSEEV